MKLLLDTHTFLWLVEGNPKLTAGAQAALADPANHLFLSVASVWELAIKIGNQKLVLSEPLDAFVGKWTATYRVDLSAIQLQHALAVLRLPDHHKDPFDRILIAQATVDNMTVVTGDTKFAPYGVPLIW